jgi:hypothetical protein
VDDEVAMKIATERLPTETDDDVVSRLVRAASANGSTDDATALGGKSVHQGWR